MQASNRTATHFSRTRACSSVSGKRLKRCVPNLDGQVMKEIRVRSWVVILATSLGTMCASRALADEPKNVPIATRIVVHK